MSAGNYARFRSPVFNLTFSGFAHLTFTDGPLWEGRFPYLGTVDGERAIHIVNAYLLAFFNHTLKNTEEPLLTGPSSGYPEVMMDVLNPS